MAGSPRNKYVQSGNTPTQNFQPNGPYYRTFCCHVRKLTIICGIVEIFIVCFLIVAVIPDLSSKICNIEDEPPENASSTVSPSPSSTINTVTTRMPTVMTSTPGGSPMPRLKRQVSMNNASMWNSTTRMIQASTPSSMLTSTVGPTNETLDDNSTDVDWSNATGIPNPPLSVLRYLTCNCNIMWLCLALIYILSANVMFYGLKSTRWYLFIPHITFRIVCILIVLLFVGFLMSGLCFGAVTESMVTTIWVLSIIGALFCIPYGYIIYNEIKCAHFVKMSAETGFSVSNTRPVGPPTLSLSDSRQPNQGTNIQMQNLSAQPAGQELPPLRHTYGTGNIGN